MTPAALVAALLLNPAIDAICARLDELPVPEALLTGGCLAQTWWNIAAGRDPQAEIRDFDLFYWAADTSWEAEDRVIRRAAALWPDLPVEARNQARVHLWFATRFGAPCPPLTSARAGVDRFLFPALRLGIDSAHSLYAPAGLDDLLAGYLRPDPTMPRLDQAIPKAADYQGRFPGLRLAAALSPPARRPDMAAP